MGQIKSKKILQKLQSNIVIMLACSVLCSCSKLLWWVDEDGVDVRLLQDHFLRRRVRLHKRTTDKLQRRDEANIERMTIIHCWHYED